MATDLFQPPAGQGTCDRHENIPCTRAERNHAHCQPIVPSAAHSGKSCRRCRAGHRWVTTYNHYVANRHRLKTYQSAITAVGSLVVSGFKQSARAGADRLLKPYLEPLSNELLSVREDVVSLVVEIRDRLGAIEAHNRATTDEIRGIRGSSDLRLDHTNLRLHQILDEVGGVSDRIERLEQHFSTVEERFGELAETLAERYSFFTDQLTERFLRLEQHFSTVEERYSFFTDQLTERFLQLEQHFSTVEERSARLEEHFFEREQRIYQRVGDLEGTLVRYFEEQAKRQGELRSGMGELADASKEQLEKLELLMMAQLEGLFGTVSSETSSVRSDVEELTRMIRMQGDAADQVAEIMGRALTRLSAEVEVLSSIVPQLTEDVAPAPA